MNAHQIKEFSEYWNATLQAKGQKPLTMLAIAMCFEDLLDYDLDTIKAALKTFRRNPDEGQYHLQVSAIVKIIEGDSKSAANKAWLEAQKLAISGGSHDDVIMKDLISMVCIDELGGLQRLCDRPTDFDLADHGRAFKSLYEHYRINGIQEGSRVAILRGSGLAERNRFGLPELKPRLIGFDGAQETSASARIPDMSVPRYPEIEASKIVSKEEAKANLSALMSYVTEGE